MEKTEIISIERKVNSRLIYESSQYSECDLTECQLMSLLGGVIGALITSPRFCSGCRLELAITLFVHD